MDRVLLLNSSGAIVSNYPPYTAVYGETLIAEKPLPIVPYVEQVVFPGVAVDSSAIYGEHPEHLATPTVSSGAALTFFCDSVAGGADSSGDGSYDRPWRSLDAASRFLACNSCVLLAAAKYIQLKVRGIVDYVSGYWRPVGHYDRLIVAGWGERCDLGTQTFFAKYFFNIRGRGGYAYAPAVYSDCALVGAFGSEHVAVDCELSGGAYLSCAYNCSGAAASGAVLSAAVCYGGSFGHRATVSFLYNTSITATSSGGGVNLTALYVRSAAVSASVTAAGMATSNTAIVTGIGLGRCLGGCVVNVTASANVATSNANASAILATNDTRVVSGGNWHATARAYAAGSRYGVVSAQAKALGFGDLTSGANVQTAFTATAEAHLTAADGEEREIETVESGGGVCTETRVKLYSAGAVYSSWTSRECH